MTRPIDFSNVPARYKNKPNKVEFVREHVLGYNRPKFIDAARGLNASFSVSAETLKNVERKGNGSVSTHTKFFDAISLLLPKHNYQAVTRDQLFSEFPPTTNFTDN